MTMGVHPHYVAPAAGGFLYLIVEGLRRLRRVRVGTLRVGRWLAGLTLLTVVVKLGMVAQARAIAPDGWAEGRAHIAASFMHDCGKHLIIIRYTRDHNVHEEWVYNAADIDAAPVVWAREMDAASMKRLFNHFHDRRVWLIEADQPRPAPLPYAPPG